MIALYVIVGIVAVGLLGVAASVRILKQYERGVQFRLGRVKDGARGRAGHAALDGLRSGQRDVD